MFWIKRSKVTDLLTLHRANVAFRYFHFGVSLLSACNSMRCNHSSLYRPRIVTHVLHLDALLSFRHSSCNWCFVFLSLDVSLLLPPSLSLSPSLPLPSFSLADEKCITITTQMMINTLCSRRDLFKFNMHIITCSFQPSHAIFNFFFVAILCTFW